MKQRRLSDYRVQDVLQFTPSILVDFDRTSLEIYAVVGECETILGAPSLMCVGLSISSICVHTDIGILRKAVDSLDGAETKEVRVLLRFKSTDQGGLLRSKFCGVLLTIVCPGFYALCSLFGIKL